MAEASDILIALDDGHGIGTAGKRTPYIKSIGRQIHENEFNEKVTLYLKAELERCGFRTLLTAPTDEDTPLKARTGIANSMGAHALVSNHYNAFDGKFDGPGKDSEGHSLHIYFNDVNDRRLAETIAKYLRQGTKQVYRGIIEQNLHMTREFNGPAVLVENGFMDNEREALLMINEDFQRETAREQARGICDFFSVPYVAAASGGNMVLLPKTTSKDLAGKRVESIYKGSEGLDFYSRPTFNDAFRAGILKYQYGFPTILRKLKVEWANMYEVKNSRGHVYYVTAAPQFVKVEWSRPASSSGQVSPSTSRPSSGGPIAVGEISIVGVADAAIIQDRPDRLHSKDLGTIAKDRTIAITGSVRGNNSSSGYWEVIYNGKRAYITGEFGRYKAY